MPSSLLLPDWLNDPEHRLQVLPHCSDPTVLGFTSGLDVELVKVHSRSLDRLLQQLPNPWGRSTGNATERGASVLLNLQHIRDRLRTLRNTLGQQGNQRAAGTNSVSQGPLRHFFRQEWDCLVEVVSSLLADINQPFQNRHASLGRTLSALSRLEWQAELLNGYLQDKSTSTYCLSAFSHPHGFLAALVREDIRSERSDISDVVLHFQVLNTAVTPASPPDSGAYLCGLELQGVQWDTQLGALQDAFSPKPSPFPILEEVSGEAGWSLAERNVIARVPLAAKLDPVLCALRRARLVSTLRDAEEYHLSHWPI